MKAIPIPERANDIGNMAGSAPGANFRMARCATTNVANIPKGTVRLSRVTPPSWLSATIAKSSMTSGAATQRRSSSLFLLVIGYSPRSESLEFRAFSALLVSELVFDPELRAVLLASEELEASEAALLLEGLLS